MESSIPGVYSQMELPPLQSPVPSLFPELHLSRPKSSSQVQQLIFKQMETSSKNEVLVDPSDITQSLSLLSLEHEVESQRTSLAHSSSNVSKLDYEDEEEAPFDLTKEIPTNYQGWYCDYMEEKEHESMIPITNLPIEIGDAIVCVQLSESAGCENPNAAIERSLCKTAASEVPAKENRDQTTLLHCHKFSPFLQL